MDVTLPNDLMRALLEYLNARPHGEVRNLIDGLLAAARPPQAPGLPQGPGEPPPV